MCCCLRSRQYYQKSWILKRQNAFCSCEWRAVRPLQQSDLGSWRCFGVGCPWMLYLTHCSMIGAQCCWPHSSRCQIASSMEGWCLFVFAAWRSSEWHCDSRRCQCPQHAHGSRWCYVESLRCHTMSLAVRARSGRHLHDLPIPSSCISWN